MNQRMGRNVQLQEGWRDNIQSFLAARLGGIANPTLSTFKGNIKSFAFNPNAVRELFITFHINHDYEEGTRIYPHIHWAPSTTNAGVVRWGFEWTSCKGHNQEAFPAPKTFFIEAESPQILHQHLVSEVPPPGLEIPGLEPDSLILVRVFRDGTHANDTYPDNAFGFQMDIHYYSDHLTTINRDPDFYKRARS